MHSLRRTLRSLAVAPVFLAAPVVAERTPVAPTTSAVHVSTLLSGSATMTKIPGIDDTTQPASGDGMPRVSVAPRTFVLVHGAWMGASCWDQVKALLERAGHTVITLDLPGHGDDPAPPEAQTMEAYTQAVVRAIGDRRDVTLVGHSLAGMVISTVAEAVPDRIARLVYVSAYLPQGGQSLLSLAEGDKDSHTGRYWNQVGPAAAAVKAEGLADVFCADCTAAQQQELVRRHRAEPLAPFGSPVTLTPGRFGRVPRFYVETLQDHAVSHTLQTAMLARTPVVRRVALDTSHSPFFTRPAELARALESFE